MTRSSTAHGRITELAANRDVHRAFNWLHLQEQRLRNWQRELVAIPAPPFAEAARAAWFIERFRELGLSDPHIDAEGNALALLRPGNDDATSRNDDSTIRNAYSTSNSDAPLILLSAHLDTVFPAGTPIRPMQDDSRLTAPGAADNGAGLTGLLALIAAMQHAAIQPRINILFAANVGEEAEGDLRGMRHLFTASPFASRITGAIALEGAGTEAVVTRALGSRRFRVTVTGPGGHSWTDAGLPNPIVALSNAITTLTAPRPLPRHPRTTLNIGQINGGTSVTSIPQNATATVDIRSTDPGAILFLEVQLHRAVEDAVIAANHNRAARLTYTIEAIGDRPAAELPSTSPLLATVRAVDRHLNLRTEERLGSTDANVPLSLGREAIAIGAGGTAGGIHTTSEWYDSHGRELALRRILFILLDLCGGLQQGATPP